MLIIGAGGHARELLDILINDGYPNEIFFFDDTPGASSSLQDYKVFNSITEVLENYINTFYCLGVGKPKYRRELSEKLQKTGLKPASIISQKSSIGQNTQLGEGLNIMPFASITNSSSIGRGSLIHYFSSVHHDVIIGDFCEISPGVRLLGASVIGEGTSIGTNAVILPKIHIGKNCIIGAGAIVTKNVDDDKTVKGIPAR